MTVTVSAPPVVVISPTGTQGPRGNAMLGAARAPLVTDGIDGDYWVDRTLYPTSVVMYGPKAAGAWPGTGVTIGASSGGGSAPTGPAGGVLAGTFPNPSLSTATIASFDAAGLAAAAQAAASTALASHEADTTAVHGIADTATLVVTTDPRLSKPALLTASGQPADATGSTGDWALDAGARTIYGPRGATAWTPFSVVPPPTASGWTRNGFAALAGTNLYLTHATDGFGAGSSWYATAQPTDGIDVTFDVEMSGGTGADGVAFALADPATATSFVGAGGGDLGLTGCSSTALALDTGSGSHARIVTTTATVMTTVATYGGALTLRPNPVAVRVRYASGKMSVWLDGTLIFNEVTVAATATARLGWTGSNGGSNDNHIVRSVSFTPRGGLDLQADAEAYTDAAITTHVAATDPHGDRADAATKYRPLQPWVFDVTAAAYGAVGDAQAVADGAMASGSAVLTSATASFATDIVGKSVSVKNAGANGVTTLVTTVASRQGPGQITLTAANASGGAVTGAVVIWGTDNTAAIQAATDAAEAYLTAHTYAQVYVPPRPFIVAGALNTSKSGNGQIVFGVYPASGEKKILEFRGVTDGAAAVRHWQQMLPQFAGSCLISLGVYASPSAQTASVNANGNPGVISGPNEGTSNGQAYGAAALFSNVMAVVKNLAILTTHSSFGLTYGAANLYGCANATVENVGYGTAGTVASPSTDYSSPGTFGTGLSVGFLLPAPGNNDHVIARNISCGGGYTYAMFVTEHTMMDRYMALYCWAGLCAVGTYAGSVGSVHAMTVASASIEACTHELYIVGAGSQGVGPTIYIGISTESSTPNIAGNSAGAMAAALGRVTLTGIFTEAGVSVSNPTGIELVNGQVPRAIKRKTAGFTASPIDRTLVCDTTAAAFTGTLPAADFNPVEYALKNVGANPLTVATTSSQLIYTTSGTGATTATVSTGSTLRVQALYNGTAWAWYAV